jgi:hypothetical protein
VLESNQEEEEGGGTCGGRSGGGGRATSPGVHIVISKSLSPLSCLLLSSLELSDTHVYETWIRARLGTSGQRKSLHNWIVQA